MNVSSIQKVCFNGDVEAKSETNLIDKFKASPVSVSDSHDKITLSTDFIADLKQNPDKIALGTIVEGYVNGKKASFKVVSNSDEENWIEGAINKNYMLLHAKNKNYDGKYGDSEFRLTVDYNKPSKLSVLFNQKILGKIFMPDYFTVKGSIGNKDIDITLPNTKVPDDPQIRDLLTLVLEDNGFKAQTIKGEIKSIKFSPSAIKNLKKKSEKREKMINNDIKPIFMQGISTATGLIIGSIVSALLFKFGLKK